MPPSPWIGSIRMPAVSRLDGRLDRLMIAERHLIEALDPGAEALQIFVLTAGGDGRQGAAVEGALKGDQPVTLRRAGVACDSAAPS